MATRSFLDYLTETFRGSVSASVPDVPSTFADISSVQTLTNKTLSSAVIANTAVISATAATLALTAALHAGRVVQLNRAAGITVTLPAATGTGNIYRLSIATALSAASHVIAVVDGTDFMRGLILSKDDGTASSVIAWATANSGTLATESDTITLDGSTKGGNLGDLIELEDIATDTWRVTGFTKSSGSEVTPFSAAV
jgi:hypothetical protein